MNLSALAGEVKITHPGKVEIKVIYPSQMGSAEGLPKAPNISVDGELLGPTLTLSELEEVVAKKLLVQEKN